MKTNKINSVLVLAGHLDDSIIAVGGMTIVSLVTTWAVSYIKDAILPFVASHVEVDIVPWEVLVVVMPYLTSILLFMLIYRIFPHMNLTMWDVWPGAVLAGLLWELAKHLFTYFLIRFGPSNLVYGSVGTIVALLLWFYVTGLLQLIGAEISAAYTHKRRPA